MLPDLRMHHYAAAMVQTLFQLSLVAHGTCLLQFGRVRGASGRVSISLGIFRTRTHHLDMRIDNQCMSDVQYALGLTYSTDNAAGSYYHEIAAAGADFTSMEPHVGTLLYPSPTADHSDAAAAAAPALARTSNRAPWVIAHIAFHAWHTRKSMRAFSWYITRTAHHLAVSDLHPLVRRAVALTHQLALSRYASVSSSAVDMLQTLHAWCWDVKLMSATAMTAAAGLCGDAKCGAPAEALVQVYELPESRDAIRAQLRAQAEVGPRCAVDNDSYQSLQAVAIRGTTQSQRCPLLCTRSILYIQHRCRHADSQTHHF